MVYRFSEQHSFNYKKETEKHFEDDLLDMLHLLHEKHNEQNSDWAPYLSIFYPLLSLLFSLLQYLFPLFIWFDFYERGSTKHFHDAHFLDKETD